MNRLTEEICIEIFKWVSYPAPLALSCKHWARIAGDPHTKATWLIFQYGKVHALFHAVRLGPSFIDLNIISSLLSQKVILSRYFIQRLLMHFGKYDEQLIMLKIEHSVGHADEDRIKEIQKKLRCPWASDLPLNVFNQLLEEGSKRLYEKYSKNVPFNETHLPLLAAAKQEDLLDPFFEKYLPTIFPQQTEENIVQKHQKKRRNFSKTGRKEDEDQKVKWKNTLLKFRDNDPIKDEDGNIYSFGKPTHLFLAKLETFLSGLSGLHSM
ncbi:hypothetical protein G9A89_016282 [Geosiphon pyriformis]|nr:hypothetical protein G9A89_016282 [Geosiphon pyriformis]